MRKYFAIFDRAINSAFSTNAINSIANVVTKTIVPPVSGPTCSKAPENSFAGPAPSFPAVLSSARGRRDFISEAPSLFPIFTEGKRSEEKKTIMQESDDYEGTGRYVNSTGLADLAQHASLVPKIISYNINSLSYYACSVSGKIRNAKINRTLSDFVKSADIICLQETNLSTSESFALNSMKGCIISRNNYKMGAAGTLIIEIRPLF